MERKQQASIADLKRLYDVANSEYERRAVCLRAIDEGVIRRGAFVSTIDEIFGTRFASKLPTGKEAIAHDHILFAPQFSPPPRPDGKVEAVDYVGWFMGLQYDQHGNVLDYYLSNVHKSPGIAPPISKEKELIMELKGLYKVANSEYGRRAVCLRAIDEGIIRSDGPISSIDELFGTRFVSDLPTRKEGMRWASVDFVTSMPSSDKPKTAANVGWLLSIEYGADSNIYNYRLTNVHK